MICSIVWLEVLASVQQYDSLLDADSNGLTMVYLCLVKCQVNRGVGAGRGVNSQRSPNGVAAPLFFVYRASSDRRGSTSD